MKITGRLRDGRWQVKSLVGYGLVEDLAGGQGYWMVCKVGRAS